MTALIAAFLEQALFCWFREALLHEYVLSSWEQGGMETKHDRKQKTPV